VATEFSLRSPQDQEVTAVALLTKPAKRFVKIGAASHHGSAGRGYCTHVIFVSCPKILIGTGMRQTRRQPPNQQRDQELKDFHFPINIPELDKSMRPLIPLNRFRIFAEGLDHPEGLAFDADGTLWVGGEPGQVYRVGSNGAVREIACIGGFSLGLTFSRAQELYVCNLKSHSLVRVNRKGRVLDSWDRCGTRKFKTPNFSVFDSEGNLYFSDSGDWGEANGCVYRLRKNGRIETFAGPFSFANGLALSGDERFLS
jgi:hypothetical protein